MRCGNIAWWFFYSIGMVAEEVHHVFKKE